MFGIRRHSNPALCPVKAIELYVAISSLLGANLFRGFLFRPTSTQGKILNRHLTSSAMQARLRFHLQDAHIYENETLHSFRAGAAITVALSGSQLADIM